MRNLHLALYNCSTSRDQGGKIWGVANIGKRPTANDRGVLLCQSFDYDGDLYGQWLNDIFTDHIRPERAFESFDELKEQIAQDAETVLSQFHRDGTRNL